MSILKNSLVIENEREGGKDGKNSAWSVIYSIVLKMHQENPESVKGDYSTHFPFESNGLNFHV